MTNKPTKTEERLKKKEEIIDIAESFFFTKGIIATSMDEIAKKAGISKGSLYLHFESKNALQRAILRRAFVRLHQKLSIAKSGNELGNEKVIKLGKAYYDFANQELGYFDMILHYENDTINLNNAGKESINSIIAGNQVLELLRDTIKDGIKDGSIGKNINPTVAAFVLWSTTTGVLQMLSSKEKLVAYYYMVSSDEILDLYYELIRRAIGNKNTN